MLLSLSIKNFKSIRSSRIRFGALTCLIGHNGVGKSNLFDAIDLLSNLAVDDVQTAASSVRESIDGNYSSLDLVYQRDPRNEVELSADMIVPINVEDDFGKEAKPSTTLLTYTVRLKYDEATDSLLVQYENLTHAKLGDYKTFTAFRSAPVFRSSVAHGSRRGGPLISTNSNDGQIMLHGDGGSRGRPSPVGRSPLTVVGGTRTYDYPTVLAAKREMSSWRVLHLEPTSMRAPDPRSAPKHVSPSGGNLPATFRSLIDQDPDIRTEITNRLRQLNSDVEDLDIYTDNVRNQYALRARIPGVTEWLFGRSLSDGTLRYIALSLMLADVDDRAVLCLEEPENGIHPSRIPALVDLLYDYAVDLEEPVDDDNPLRQVIVNSHSPEVARQLQLDDIVFVERSITSDGPPSSVFRAVEETWRAGAAPGKAGESDSMPKSRQAVVDFIGGAPIKTADGVQLAFEFGTAN